ncbi:cytochrome P450 [Actinomadura parmotrematis]|uniref:Cytochrome P450 n=1 Tax=Actinomadura parmotrematis TaxID=2864039 RepID=A0ABS7FXD8_9ACTN|nr:cytochrome P450 [Actinomadura parmotrematis]MBW8484344.1 cytochrome P450 [Actinomadura parmotrematis]
MMNRPLAPDAARHESRLLWSANPGLFALLEAARHLGPIARVPRLGWVVTDPLLARRVLNDHAAFTMGGEGGVGHMWTQLFGPEMGAFFGGSRHAEIRARARDLFTEDAAADLVERSQGGHHAALAALLASGAEVDVADAARVLAGRMVADLLGLPADSPDQQYRDLFAAGESLAALALGTTASTDLPEDRLAAAREIADGLTAGVPDAYRDAGPGTLLGRCRAMGLGLPLARGLATLLVIAGTETGVAGTTRTVALLHDTGAQHALLRDPSLLPNAVREGLRVATPAPVIGRHVERDAELGGRTLRAGDRVLLLTYRATNGAGPFDITRPHIPETRQLWFGGGRHLCLGASVARVQIARMLETLHSTGRPYRIVSRRAAHRALVPTYASLVVRAGS